MTFNRHRQAAWRMAAALRAAPALLLLLPACQLLDAGGDEGRLRVGAGGGVSLVSVGIDGDDPLIAGPELRDATGASAMVEIGHEVGDALALARLRYTESSHDVVGFGAEAEVRQYAVQGLVGLLTFGGEAVSLQPLLGLGVGHLELDYSDNPFLRDESSTLASLVLGAELRVLRRVLLGATMELGQFSWRHDTRGHESVLTIYGGVRF